MGDRGVIEVRSGSNVPSIYFYTHWEASRLPELVAKGLEAGRNRWGDVSYLNRILFDNLTELSGGETGFGIDLYCPADAWRKVVIDHSENTVQLAESSFGEEWVATSDPIFFGEFISQHK